MSVVLPVRDRPADLVRALQSVRAQTRPPDEVVVVDDGSTEPLDEVLRQFADLPLVPARHAVGRGAAAARNTGAELASGEWLAFLDSDDLWTRDKLAVQLPALGRAGVDAGCTAFVLHRGTAAAVRGSRTGVVGRRRVLEGADLAPGTSLVVRRSLFAELGGFDSAFERLEDWDLLLRLTGRTGLLLLAEPLAEVFVGRAPATDAVLRSLDLLVARHLPALRGADRTTFRATVTLERAACALREGRRTTAARLALGALMKHPPHVRRVAQRLRA